MTSPTSEGSLSILLSSPLVAIICVRYEMEYSKEEIEKSLEWERRYLISPIDRGRDYLPSMMVRGEGSYMWDQDGKRYLDFFSQTWNVNIGHGNRKVIEAIKRQADELTYLSPMKTSLVQKLIPSISNDCSSKAYRLMPCFLSSASKLSFWVL